MQMGSIDYAERKRQITTAKRKELVREREDNKRMKSEEVMRREEQHCHDVYQLFDGSSEENEVTSDDSSKVPSEALPKKGTYNTKDISNIALASI